MPISLRISSLALALIALLISVPFSASAATDPEITITSALATKSTKPTLKGEATDTTYVRVVVETESGKKVFNKSIKVKNEKWSAKISKKLAKGDYDVSVYAGKSASGTPELEETLTIGTTESSNSSSTIGKGTTLVASPVSLLFGGSARVLNTMPVAYVKVTNTSTKESGIDGITLVQNGSAPVSVFSSFITSDDKGGSRATNAVTASSFKKNAVFVPLKATIPAGQFRIFTIKAGLGIDSLYNVGKQVKLDVQSIQTGAKVLGTVPMMGTTWTLSY